MITDLKKLWKQAFGDSDEFLDIFFTTAYSPDRCRYLTQDGQLATMLYWFDCSYNGKKIAYIYAVATDQAFQNMGLCRKLMTQTHDLLQSQNYSGAILVPGSKELFALYEKLGYRTCSFISQISCAAGAPIPMRAISAREYGHLRHQFLPDGGVVQEGAALALLEKIAVFYAGENFLLAAATENNTAHVHELLGSVDPAGVIAALGADKGHIRTPGKDVAFAMYHPFTDDDAPAYFGLALD